MNLNVVDLTNARVGEIDRIPSREELKTAEDDLSFLSGDAQDYLEGFDVILSWVKDSLDNVKTELLSLTFVLFVLW